jgi:hypothetical protein
MKDRLRRAVSNYYDDVPASPEEYFDWKKGALRLPFIL